MYPAWQLAIKYLHYYFTASNGKGHGIHSPFIFQFIRRVLNDKEHNASYEQVEDLRQQLLKDNSIIKIEDFGAGSSFKHTRRRTIASIAKNSAKPPKYGQLLFRIVKEFKPKTILELGTSLGLTTSYLSLANPDAKIITMEGAPDIAARARLNFDKLRLQNITVIEGNFDDHLLSVVIDLPVIDLAFIDGNHKREPTIRYFREIHPKTNSDSILVFDDIHWSREMEEAWEIIKNDPEVRCSVDLFSIGILFFRDEFRQKQHFRIRF